MCTRSVYDPGRPVSRTGRTSGRLGCLLVLTYLALVIPTLPAHATCPAPILASSAATSAAAPKTASDGAGGSYVVWLTPSGQLFALRVDLHGRIVSNWPAAGLQVTTQTGIAADEYNICADSKPGQEHRLVIVWQGTSSKIFAQRISSSSGTPALDWVGGKMVFSTSSSESYPVIAADEIGGCFIAAEVYSSTTDQDIYVQRIDNLGATWGTSAVACNANYMQYQPTIAYVGNNAGIYYAVIAWTDRRYSSPGVLNEDIFAQSVDSNGTVVWGANGNPVVVGDGNPEVFSEHYKPVVGRGDIPREAFVIWSDERSHVNNRSDLYIQRLHADGSAAWAANGLLAKAAADGQDSWRNEGIGVVPVPNTSPGGVQFTWYARKEYTSPPQYYIMAQERLDDGTIPGYWGGPEFLAGPSGNKVSASMVGGDGSGGFALSWLDSRSGNYDVYATRYLFGGMVSGWAAGGNGIGSGDAGTQTGVALLSGSPGGVLVVWSQGGNIYEQATSSTGTPAIVTVPQPPANVRTDPGCTGYGVTVRWDDVCSETEYHVYRNGTYINTVSQNSTSYFDANDLPTSPPAGNYEYSVRSYNSTGGEGNAGSATGCMPPRLQLLSPNGNQSWTPNTTQTIQWIGPSDPVTIQLFVDGAPSGGSMQGVSTTLTTNATGGSYSFTVPDVATTRARVQLSQVQNGTTKYAYSANPFTMATLPGSIAWTYSYIDDVNHGWNESDMCANGSGGVYAVYYDYLSGMDLRFASKSGSAYPWNYGVAQSAGTVGIWPSIVSTSSGIVHIAYQTFQNDGSSALLYISGNPANSSPSSWAPETVASLGGVTGVCSITLDTHNYPYIAFNTGSTLAVFKRSSGNHGTWSSYGTWVSEDIVSPDHITLKYDAVHDNMFWVACTDQQSSRLNLWNYNGQYWVKLNATNFVPGPYTDVSLILDPNGHPNLAYTVPSNGGQSLIFQPWAQDGSGMGTPVTVDGTLGTISGVSLQYGLAPNNYPRIGYVGNGVVKQATAGPSGWTRQVVDATGNMDAQVSLVVQPNDDRYYLYRNLTFNTMSSAGPYDGTGGGGGPPHHGYAGTITIPNGVTEPERLVVSGGLSSTPIRFQFVGATSPRPASIHIYDVQGRLVRALAGGDDDVVWDMRNRVGSHVVPGVYFYRAVAGSSTYQGKTVVSR